MTVLCEVPNTTMLHMAVLCLKEKKNEKEND